MDSFLSKAEAADYVMKFVGLRGERGASREEIHTLISEIEDLKIKHHLFALLERGSVIVDIDNGELCFVTKEFSAAQVS